jgi:adenylate cyclase
LTKPIDTERRLVAIFAADVEGYSRLMGADEVRTLRDLTERRGILDGLIASHRGRIANTAGDSVLAEFSSAVDAVQCAVEAQIALAAGNVGLSPDQHINFRIGVHVGDVMVKGGDLFGDGVNIAARLQTVATAGGVCISAVAHEQVRKILQLNFKDLGTQSLKNIEEAIRAYAVSAADAGALGTSIILSPPKPPERPSIAVLPFANMSGDIEQEYFADGISEDIITALSKLSQLFVIARNSSFAFKGKNVHVQEVSTKLGVRYVLEGSVRKSGNRVRITSQLIDATTGGHLWGERFDRDLTDIFAVQDDVTHQIVAALSVNLSPGDRQRLSAEHTENLEAFDYFLRGRELWWLHAKENNFKARELLQHAIELDPNFAPAHGFLAAAHINDYVSQWSASPSQSLEKANEAVMRAAALDDKYPYTYWGMTFVNLWMRRYDDAVRAAERSISLNPNFAEGHNALGVILHYVGRSEEAFGCFDRAMALDPLCPGMWLHFQAQAAFQLGRYETAAALLKRRIVRNPDTDASRVLLAASYGQMGRIEEARVEWQEVFRVNPDYSLEHRRKVLPYKNPDDFECVVDGLRKAGLVA